MEKIRDLPAWVIITFIICAMMQSTWLFVDSRKRESMPWFWGIWGLIQIPTPIICYFIFVRSGWFKRRSRRSEEEK